MPVTIHDQLGAPASTKYITGENVLHRYFLNAATAATPVAPVNISGVQEVTPDAVAFAKTGEMFQQGGGDERYMYKSMPSYNVSVRMLAADVASFLAAIQSVTWGGVGGYSAMPLVFADYPLVSIESIYRLPDNYTHAGSMLFQDLILKEFNMGSPNDLEVVDVPFYSRHVPLRIKDGFEAVYDVFTGDGSTTVFTLSSTPLAVTDVSEVGAALKDDFALDNLIFCKIKLTTDTVGVRQKTGYTLVSTALTFTTAPAVSARVEVLYLKTH